MQLRWAAGDTKIDGNLPRRAENLIREWVAIHGDELTSCWERAINNQPPGTVEPLP